MGAAEQSSAEILREGIRAVCVLGHPDRRHSTEAAWPQARIVCLNESHCISRTNYWYVCARFLACSRLPSVGHDRRIERGVGYCVVRCSCAHTIMITEAGPLHLKVGPAGMTCKVHPTVLVTICESFIRRPAGSARVIGTLLGNETADSAIEIKACYAVPHEETDEQVRFEPWRVQLTATHPL